MIRWILLAWCSPILIILWFWIATKSLWIHLHFPPHRQRMARAALCMEAAAHFGYPRSKTWINQAWKLCEGCGCPVDLWPAPVVQMYVVGAS